MNFTRDHEKEFEAIVREFTGEEEDDNCATYAYFRGTWMGFLCGEDYVGLIMQSGRPIRLPRKQVEDAFRYHNLRKYVEETIVTLMILDET